VIDVVKYAIGGLLLISLLGASSKDPFQPRYVIFNGIENFGEPSEQKRIIKLDTETGASWVYYDNSTSGKTKMGWYPLAHFDPPSEPTK
jgi:hypothetical protein